MSINKRCLDRIHERFGIGIKIKKDSDLRNAKLSMNTLKSKTRKSLKEILQVLKFRK